MRRAVLAVVVAVGVGVPLAIGTAIASAGADDRRVISSTNSSASGVGDDRTDGGDGTSRDDRTGGDPGFEIEIDPRLDARFGPRPVNAVQAARIVEQAFPGARVVEAKLDEENGGPIWEMEFILNGREREVDVDAATGAILRD